MTDLEALVVAAYVFADDYPVPSRCGRPPLVSDAEIVALAVCQAAIGTSSDRQFLGLVGRVLPGWFPHLPDQSQYNRRLRGLVELLSIVQQRLAAWLATGGGRRSRERLAADNVLLLTPDKTRTADNQNRERALASTRLVIESVFSNLKGQMRLEQHLAKTPAGLAVRIAQRILALTIGMLLNPLVGPHAPSPPTTAAESHQASSRRPAGSPPRQRRAARRR